MLLRPGVTCDTAVHFFDGLQYDPGLTNVKNSIPNASQNPGWPPMLAAALVMYTDWTAQVIKKIREIVDDPIIAARPRNDTYFVIIASSTTEPRTISMLNGELQELSAYFMECANELRMEKECFKDHVGRSLVLDTNDFLHYQRFDKIPWIADYGPGTRLVIPHVVVDEIDTKSYSEGDKIRKRARAVYRVLETYMDQIDNAKFARLPDGTILEILADDPGHPRMPNNDDEIVARASFLQQAIAPHKVTVISRDLGMRTRARARQLDAEKLNDKYLIPAEGLSAASLDAAVASIDPAPEEHHQDSAGTTTILPPSSS
jgi:rRNA-processing protein FCF1